MKSKEKDERNESKEKKTQTVNWTCIEGKEINLDSDLRTVYYCRSCDKV